MSEMFLSQVAATAADQPVQVIVRYADAGAMATVNELAAGDTGLDMGQQFELIPAQVVSGTPEALMALNQSPAVVQIWEDLPVHTMLDVSVPKVRAPQMWNLGFDGEGVKVAVVDTGIDPNHPDFDSRILAVRDFTNPSGTGRDGHGHGTHVASTILGSGAASAGRYIGVAPEAELLVAKVLADNGSGMTSNVMAGVEWAVQAGRARDQPLARFVYQLRRQRRAVHDLRRGGQSGRGRLRGRWQCWPWRAHGRFTRLRTQRHHHRRDR